jgi:hypothetical protein
VTTALILQTALQLVNISDTGTAACLGITSRFLVGQVTLGGNITADVLNQSMLLLWVDLDSFTISAKTPSTRCGSS